VGKGQADPGDNMSEIDLTINEIDALLNDERSYEHILQSKSKTENQDPVKEPDDFQKEKQ